MTHRARILWIDLEMTGLDHQADLILEAAAIATDWDFTEIASYEGIVRSDEAVLRERFDTNSAFWNLHQQVRDELTKQNQTGKGLHAVEDDLLAFIDEHFKADQPVLLGGNSVHMDRRFIAAYWPRLDTRLHYRMCDVSAWKVVFEGKYGRRYPKPEAHRALEDIRGSIAELRHYLQYVGKQRQAEALP